jgi:hypothetical protein
MASEPSHTLLGFTDVFGAGPRALAVRDANQAALAAQIDAGSRQAGHSHPALFSEACAGGAWELIREHLAHEPIAELPRLAPLLLYGLLVPYLGPAVCSEVGPIHKHRLGSTGNWPYVPPLSDMHSPTRGHKRTR